MRILSTTLRILTVLCIGGGLTLWLMGRSNLKEKLGGDPNDPYLGTTIDSIFSDETSTAYKILQADDELESRWEELEASRTVFENTFDDGTNPSPQNPHPFKVLSDTELKKAGMDKLVLRYPDPEKDQDENGVPDVNEQLPGTIRTLNAQDIYDNKAKIFDQFPESDLLSVEEADSLIDGLFGGKDKEGLQNAHWRSEVYTPATENIEKTDLRKNPHDGNSKTTYQKRLKTVLGKLYLERHGLYKRISELRKLAVARDIDLQKKQIGYIAMVVEKENFDTQSQHFQLNLQDTQREFELAKKDWGEQKDALDQRIKTTEDNLRATETAKKEADEEWRTKMEQTRNDYENQLKEKERDAIAREQKGYERGREEVLQDTGQKLAGTEKPENFFEDTAPAPAPATFPPMTSPPTNPPGGTVAGGLQVQTVSGIVTNVARISAKDGIIILPIGSNRGVALGSTFTLIHEGKQAARIKVTQTTPTYCVANILPKFGDPHRLRSGDQIQVIQ